MFVVFGTPSRVAQSHQAPNEAPRRLALGNSARPVGFVEGTETTHTWTYDRERTPKLLEALSIPTLTVTIIVEPNRNKDELQNPGLINEYREKLARSTIVNPDLIPGGAAATPAVAARVVRATLQPLTAAVRVVLEKAPPVGPSRTRKSRYSAAPSSGARGKRRRRSHGSFSPARGAGDPGSSTFTP